MVEIKKITDKTGELVLIMKSDVLVNTPVIPLMLRVHAEIVEKGLAQSMIPFSNTSRIVWAERKDGNVIGGICYEYKPEIKCGWLILSFTSESERGKGINSLIHPIYERECKRLGATHLASLVSIENTSRLRSLNNVGLVPTMYRTHKNI